MALTSEAIASTSGYDLDALAYTHVFRRTVSPPLAGGKARIKDKPRGQYESSVVPRYHWPGTSQSAAALWWELVGEMRRRGWLFDLKSYEAGDGLGEWYAQFHHPRGGKPDEAPPMGSWRGNNVGEAVCRAALLALLDAEEN